MHIINLKFYKMIIELYNLIKFFNDSHYNYFLLILQKKSESLLRILIIFMQDMKTHYNKKYHLI